MAETNRVSGRQAASTSGRQAAPASASGRVGAPSPSGRMPAAPPRAASSARMAPAAPTSTSGRAAAPSASGRSAASGRAAPPAPSRASARKGGVGRSRGDDGGGKKKKTRAVGGKELIIAAAAIAVLAGIVIVLAMRNSARVKEATDAVHAKEESERINYDAAEKTYTLAYERAFKLVTGKEEFNEGKHFGSFLSDSSIYNVVYERRYKDKKGNEKTEQHAIHPDKLSLMKTEYGTDRDGLSIRYALAENKSLNVVMATKSVKPAEGDTLTVAAQITVIIKAPAEDPRFDKARNATVPEPAKETPKEAPKEAGK